MQVYYFTRTGRSQAIAETLAERYGVQAQRIEDGRSWSGALGYLKAGYQSATGKTLPVICQKPTDGDQIALVFPIWAGGFPPAVKTFVEEVGRDRVIAVPTSLASILKDREGFCKIIDLVGKSIALPAQL